MRTNPVDDCGSFLEVGQGEVPLFELPETPPTLGNGVCRPQVIVADVALKVPYRFIERGRGS
jgi:hypothetical protein